jgi:hypothetical protein
MKIWNNTKKAIKVASLTLFFGISAHADSNTSKELIFRTKFNLDSTQQAALGTNKATIYYQINRENKDNPKERYSVLGGLYRLDLYASDFPYSAKVLLNEKPLPGDTVFIYARLCPSPITICLDASFGSTSEELTLTYEGPEKEAQIEFGILAKQKNLTPSNSILSGQIELSTKISNFKKPVFYLTKRRNFLWQYRKSDLGIYTAAARVLAIIPVQPEAGFIKFNIPRSELLDSSYEGMINIWMTDCAGQNDLWSCVLSLGHPSKEDNRSFIQLESKNREIPFLYESGLNLIAN